MTHNSGLNSFAYTPGISDSLNRTEIHKWRLTYQPCDLEALCAAPVFWRTINTINVPGIGPSDGGTLCIWKRMIPDSVIFPFEIRYLLCLHSCRYINSPLTSSFKGQIKVRRAWCLRDRPSSLLWEFFGNNLHSGLEFYNLGWCRLKWPPISCRGEWGTQHISSSILNK